MKENQKKHLIYEGIKERIDDLAEDDIYFKYGRLIALGIMDFSIEKLDNSRVLQNARIYLSQTKKNLNW